jgi:hypothetical protein
MVLDNQTGASLPDGFVDNINSFMEEVKEVDEPLMDNIIDNHNIKIIIIPGTSYSRNGDELNIGVEAVNINGIIYSFFGEIISVINNFNSNIRLANALKW